MNSASSQYTTIQSPHSLTTYSSSAQEQGQGSFLDVGGRAAEDAPPVKHCSFAEYIPHPTHSPLWFISGGGGKITRQLRSSAGASVSIINTFQHFESVILLIARHRRQAKTYNNFRAPVHRQDQSRFRLNLIPHSRPHRCS